MRVGKKASRVRRRSQRLYRQGIENASSLLALSVDPILASDPIVAADIIDTGERTALIKGKFTEKSPERVVKKITSCPVAELGLSPKYCELMGYTAQRICKPLHDRLKFTLIRCMTKGDGYCEWIVERESELGSERHRPQGIS